jgi:tRNA-Thr(GGU) m(6)t(6)A37 methyltransferase TsaA
MEMKPIGFVKSPVTEPVDENWGGVVSRIHLAKPWGRGLKGLAEFSHLVVLFHMHQATHNPATDLVRRPRGRADMPKLGIFAQRAKHRPNPVGITAVKLLGIRGSTMTVRGLDAVDGSPVLDIKPYVPEFDRVDRPTVPKWMKKLLKGYF